MVFEYTSLSVSGQPDLKFVVYTPLEEEQTIRKLDALLQLETSRAHRIRRVGAASSPQAESL